MGEGVSLAGEVFRAEIPNIWKTTGRVGVRKPRREVMRAVSMLGKSCRRSKSLSSTHLGFCCLSIILLRACVVTVLEVLGRGNPRRGRFAGGFARPFWPNCLFG